jgi:hypothetical protein
MAASMEKDLRSHLLADTGIAAVVVDRVYPRWPRKTFSPPYITFERAGTEHATSMRGSSGLAKGRVLLAVWSESFEGARALIELIRLRLTGFTGTVGGTQFQGITVQNDLDFREPNSNLFGVEVDCGIWFAEAQPE